MTLPKRGFRVRVLLRRPTALPPEASGAVVGDLAAPRNMAAALAGVEAVIRQLAAELDLTMALAGCRSVHELDRSSVT